MNIQEIKDKAIHIAMLAYTTADNIKTEEQYIALTDDEFNKYLWYDLDLEEERHRLSYTRELVEDLRDNIVKELSQFLEPKGGNL